MARYRKKPAVIEAVLWDGQLDTKPDWLRGARGLDVAKDCRLVISTLEGRMTADLGDWIICGIDDELYPCKPHIFAATYEPVDESIAQLVNNQTGRSGG